MNISWFSNAPWQASGYGIQTKLFAPRIRKLGHKVSITAYSGLQGGLANFDGIKVYPGGFHPYGQDIMGAAAAQEDADIVIALTDAWVLEPDGLPLRWFPWFPVDCEPIPGNVAKVLKKATGCIAMSRYGQEQAERTGLHPYYVPHGVNTEIYKRVAGARERLKWPTDKFIVGMVASNKSPRKSQLEQIAAFAALHKQHPETMLYLHMASGQHNDGCCDLPAYAEILGLNVGFMTNDAVSPDTDVLFVDQYTHTLGLPDPYMVDVYNAFDVLMNVSQGEGFGVPIIEAQACGTPVIVGAWTSMTELCGSGWKIGKDEARVIYDPPFKSFRYSVSVEAVLDRLLKAFQMWGNEDYRGRARTFALQYDADKVTEKYWKPVLDDIAANLTTGGETGAMVDKLFAGLRV